MRRRTIPEPVVEPSTRERLVAHFRHLAARTIFRASIQRTEMQRALLAQQTSVDQRLRDIALSVDALVMEVSDLATVSRQG